MISEKQIWWSSAHEVAINSCGTMDLKTVIEPGDPIRYESYRAYPTVQNKLL